MYSISFFKKISLFFFYRKIISSLKVDLEKRFNARVDGASRIYTVLNIPADKVEEPYNIRKSDIDAISETYIKDYANLLAIFLDEKGLSELYTFYKVEKVEKYSYLLIFGFSLFDSQKFLTNFIFYFIPSLLLLISVLIFLCI
jgi:hypothetical protein